MTDASNPIIFYDIPSPRPGSAWSPNTWKTRYALNYKGLHYRTEWVEYPDIEKLCKDIGASYTSTNEDGTPYYSLPVIKDPSTGVVVPDSFAIALYLDKTYPNTPLLFPPGTKGLIAAFENSVTGALKHAFDALIGGVLLNPPSEKYFHATRSKTWGKDFADIAPKGEERKKSFEAFKTDLTKLTKLYTYEDGPYIMGNTISYADLLAGGWFIWIKISLSEWEEMKTWHDSILDKIVESVEKYAEIK